MFRFSKNFTPGFSLRDHASSDPRGAFTLIEMMVVIGVSVSLAALLLVYGSSAKEQSALSVEEAKIAQLILRARSLAIATYNQTVPPPPCGYGVRIQPAVRRYVLFSYDYPNDPQKLSKCRSVTNVILAVGGATYRVLESQRLDSVVNFVIPLPPDWMQAVFFKPPDPTVLLLPGAASNPPFKKVYLEGKSGGTSRTITVTASGELSF